MRRFIPFLIIFAVLAGLLGYFNFSRAPKERNELLLYGNVDVRQVELGFRVNGRLEKMFFEEGEFVAAGKHMASLNIDPYKDLQRQAEASLALNKASLQNAERLLKRRRELTRDGGVSQEDLDNALTTLETQNASVLSAIAALGVTKTNLEDTRLFAPNDGTILTRIREPGAVVEKGNPVYTLSLTDPIWVRAYVTEPDLGLIYPDMPAEIFTDTPGAPTYHGHIGFISPVSEFTPKFVETTQLRTDLVYRLRIIVDNPDNRLKQGMPVTVRLQ
ncbi:MAG: efflux RND transporter periplasmic adaptor subunit, partial [Parachlamydiaceae bacterium]|nr:efflux RND transporter periplasmic adaptor subunit [Parachlamydiaceae bacterium]